MEVSRLTPLAGIAAGAVNAGALVLAGDIPHAFTRGERVLYVEGAGDLLVLLGIAVLGIGWVLVLWHLRRRRAAAAGTLLAGLCLLALSFHLVVGAAAPGPAEEEWRDGRDQAAPTPTRRPPILLVAVDALSWNRLLPLVAAGRLPNVASLMRTGAYGTLLSERTYRPLTRESGYWSPVVWTSMATGVTVERHQVTGFQIADSQGQTRLARTHDRRAPAFWTLWSDFGRSLGVAGWWVTFPAEEINGIMVSSLLGLRGFRDLDAVARIEDTSWFRQRPHATFPKWYRHTVANEIGVPQDTAELIRDRVFPLERYPLRSAEDRQQLYSIVWQDQLYQRIVLHWLRTVKFDLYSVYFEGVDLVSHHYWQYMEDPESLATDEIEGYSADSLAHAEIVNHYYEVVDGFLGELMEALPPDGVTIVVSDHGFAPDPSHPYRADHSPFGVFIASGPGIRAGLNVNLSLVGSARELIRGPITVHDVLPTLLYLHGLPISRKLDGEAIFAIFEEEHLVRHPAYRVATYMTDNTGGSRPEPLAEESVPDKADREEMEKRLKSLGYIQ